MKLYFIGIGGIGMSALVRYFLSKGDSVAGYDLTPSPLTHTLSEEGATIHYEDDPELIPRALPHEGYPRRLHSSRSPRPPRAGFLPRTGQPCDEAC